MSAILKDQSSSTDLVLTDKFLPSEFYTRTPEVVSEIKARIALVDSVAFEVTDSGKASLKKYQSDERKLIKGCDTIRKEEYSRLIGETKIAHDAIFEQIKLWADAVSSKSAQFDEYEANILRDIRCRLKQELDSIIESSSLLPDFISKYDIEPIVKLTGTLTDGGKLTKKAVDFLKTLVESDLSRQILHDNRLLTIENACFRAEINPPLGKVHFGETFWSDDRIFQEKLNDLVTAEIARRTEMAMRIEADLKKKEQAKIDEALAKERERIRLEEQAKIAQEMPKVEPSVVKEAEPTPEELRARAREIKQCAEYADRNADRNREIAAAEKLLTQAKELEAKAEELKVLSANNKKLVTITATFQVLVRESISIEAVENHFKSKLSDDLKAILTTCTGA